MAQLYKMTLYVCDLEDSLSLDEIKTLIEQDALNGISVNCVCHFADSKIGQNVEWNDDIDLNRCDCPTSAWEKCFAPPTKERTNADRIRAMSDEELVVFLDGFSGRCLDCAEDAKNKSCPIYKEGRYCRPRDIMEWLKQPPKGE